MGALKEKPEIKMKLTVVKGPHMGQVFQLNKEMIVIGRSSDNAVVLMNDPQISRNHAQISVINGEVEVANLSQKNALIVEGHSVQKWKLVNNSSFTIGDSEIRVEYDLGQVVVSVPAGQVANVIPMTKPVGLPQKKKVTKPRPASPQAVSTRSQVPAGMAQGQALQQRAPQGLGMPGQMGVPGFQQPNYNLNPAYQPAPQTGNGQNDSLMANPNFKFVLIALILIGVAYSYFSTPDKKSQAKKIASTLKYEDEINARLVSKKEKELEEDREALLKQKMSPQSFRVNESFLRGMRDFQLGNYVRAQEFFQVVLNLEPDHVLAKRHLYLAKVRFDELVQEKLMLGDSYYKKHNFRMCQSMYNQVMHMLEGKNNEQKYLLAQKKSKECSLAEQGIQ
jgi:pSer/pThr/pTyr-binding forkhead associated (FHA) protein